MFTEIKTMTNDELSQLAAEIRAEQEIRERNQKEILWRAVQDAVKAYTAKFGAIEVSDECEGVIEIGRYDDLSQPGIMAIKYDY